MPLTVGLDELAGDRALGVELLSTSLMRPGANIRALDR